MISTCAPNGTTTEPVAEQSVVRAFQGQMRLVLHGRRYVRTVLSLRRALENLGVVRIFSMAAGTDDTVVMAIEVTAPFDVESFLGGFSGIAMGPDFNFAPGGSLPICEVILRELELWEG